jgi:cytochrome c peroxidase
MTRLLWISVIALASGGCGSASDHGSEAPALDPAVRAKLLTLALPAQATAPADSTNKWADDPAAATLGQRLFFSPTFSGQLLEGDNDGSEHTLGKVGEIGKVACAGCHLPETAFTDSRSLGKQISLASAWGRRRAPSLLDVAQSKLLMWDGRRDALYNQVFGVIESPVEMNSSRLYAAEQVFALERDSYEAVFGPMPLLDDSSRFPMLTATGTGCAQLDQTARACKGVQHGTPGDGAEFDHLMADDQDAVTRVVVNAGKAIAAYERLLSCGDTRFDRWVRGEDPTALSATEQRGAALFVGKGDCAGCHSGPYMSDEQFHNVGLKPEVVATVFIDADDPGASAGLTAALADPLNVSGKFSDGDDSRLPSAIGSPFMGAFRTPKLRCVAERPSFLHTAQLSALEDVVSFFDAGGDQFGFLGTSELTALDLSAEERNDLVAFLRALSGSGPPKQLLVAP